MKNDNIVNGIELNFADGILSFDLYRVFENMTDEQRLELASTFSFSSRVPEAIAREMRENPTTGPSYNADFHELKRLFFLVCDDETREADWEIKEGMKSVVESLLRENLQLRMQTDRMFKFQSKLYRWLESHLGNGEWARKLLYDFNSEWVESSSAYDAKLYDVEKASENVAEQYNRIVEEWCDAMMEIVASVPHYNEEI